MAEGNREVLTAIDGLTKLVEANHSHLEDKFDMLGETVTRHGSDIGELYKLDRDQSKAIADLDKEAQPAITHARDSKKWTAAIFVASLGSIGAAFGKGIVAFFKSGGAQ